MLAISDPQGPEEPLALAAARLSGKGLLSPGGTLSQRFPERGAFLTIRMERGKDVPEHFEWTALDTVPRSLHHRIYAARPDVGAIIAAELTWTCALSRLDLSLPAVFDEQVRHLGVEVKRVGLRSGEDGQLHALANGANAYCLDDISLCFGMGLERLLLNVEILEKCAQSFVLATCGGADAVKRIPWLIKFIANRRLQKDHREAASRHSRGLRSILKAGY